MNSIKGIVESTCLEVLGSMLGFMLNVFNVLNTFGKVSKVTTAEESEEDS